MEQESLNSKMENARRELCKLEQRYGLGHSSVLQQSMVLDELINQFNRTYYTQTKRSSKKNNQLVNRQSETCTVTCG